MWLRTISKWNWFGKIRAEYGKERLQTLNVSIQVPFNFVNSKYAEDLHFLYWEEDLSIKH